MSYDAGNRYSATAARPAVIDEGLRSYMLRVYNYMASGLALTGIVAWLTASSPAMIQAIYGTPLMWVVILAPLGFVIFLSFRITKMSFAAAQIIFWIYAAVMGLSLAWIFLAFTGASVARVFFITAASFAGLSLYGYTTKRDLTPMAAFFMVGLIGLIVASLVNIFVASTALQFAISVIGVLVFAGLTAWDTQAIKELYTESDSGEIAGKKSIMGALRLYLDFINLFIMLLRLMGDRR